MTRHELRPYGSAPPDRGWTARADVELEEARERLIQALGVHYANDDVTTDELERRLALAFRATTPAALEELVADLPPLSPELSPAPAMTESPASGAVPERGVLAAIMGGQARKGSWVLPRYLKVVAIMGGAELDLRQARFAPGVSEIEVFALMGGVEILVPPGVRVEVMGVAIMGGFEASAGDASALDAGQPVLRLSGLAIMGGVEAKHKRPSTKALAKFRAALKTARKRAEKER